jgi:hypothetical protein
MIITKAQFQLLAKELHEDFLLVLANKLSIQFPTWIPNASAEEKVMEVRRLVEYAQGLNVRKRKSLEDFATYMIRLDKTLPLPHECVMTLKNASMKEDSRIEKVFLLLAGNRLNLTYISNDYKQ